MRHAIIKSQLHKAVKSASEKALDIIEAAPRIRLDDLKDNPGARTMGRQVKAQVHNQAGHTIGELQSAAKPPAGWVWGDFYRPWHRMFPGDKNFNGDINLRREYIPLSLIELQRMIDLDWLDTTKLIDICALCATRLFEAKFVPNEGEQVFSTPINLEVQWASLTAIAAIERAGGRIRTAYYDLESLKAAENPEAWFRAGKPIPRRMHPPHSLYNYYSDPDYRGYLADSEEIEKSKQKLAEILEYGLKFTDNNDQKPPYIIEDKTPDQVFLGLEPGQLVSLEDKKVFEPTHPTLVDYYKRSEPLSDYAR